MKRTLVLVSMAAALMVATALPALTAEPDWVEQIRIQGAEQRFGNAIAASPTAVVLGAPGSSTADAGAVYVYEFDGAEWIQQAKLEASDLDWVFGSQVAISGDVLVVGRSGGTAVFEFDGTTWRHRALLAVGNADVDDGTIVGAADGSISVFTKRHSQWRIQATLSASTGSPLGGPATSSGRIVANAGAEGAYVFDLQRGRWRQQAQIPVPDASAVPSFNSVDVSGDTIIGSIQTVGTSAVYVFGLGRSGWVSEAYLEAPDPEVVFGDGEIDDGTIVLGAFIDYLTNRSGAAHVFRERSGVWTEVDTLTPSDGNRTDFGRPVAISGNVIVVSDVFENAVYVFGQ